MLNKRGVDSLVLSYTKQSKTKMLWLMGPNPVKNDTGDGAVEVKQDLENL